MTVGRADELELVVGLECLEDVCEPVAGPCDVDAKPLLAVFDVLVVAHAQLPPFSREAALSLPSPSLRMLMASSINAASGLVASLRPGRSANHQSLFA